MVFLPSLLENGSKMLVADVHLKQSLKKLEIVKGNL